MKKYTDSHEWILMETDEIGKVGVSDYARKELGNIVYIELPKVGQTVQAGQEAVVLESTKAAADIYSPISGEIVSVNEALKESPELFNQSLEEECWLFKIRISNPVEFNLLMDNETYQKLLNQV